MIKGFRQIASLTALSRLFGMVRDIGYAYFFGPSGLLDAWFLAFKIPNLSRRLFGEGAASASFIPVYSEQLHTDSAQAKHLVNTVVTVLFIVLAGLVLIGWAFIWAWFKFREPASETALMLSLTSIMLPYMLLVCMVAILAGILNVHRHFAAPAAAPIILNICIIATLLVSGLLLGVAAKQQLFAIAVAVLVAGLIQIAIQLPPLKAHGVRLRPGFDIRTPAFKKVIFLIAPMIIGLTATQINTLCDDIIAWVFSASAQKGQFFTFMASHIAYPMKRGSVSYLNFSQRLYQMPLGVFGIALATAIFPVMSAESARGDIPALKKTIAKGITGGIFIAVPATAGLLIVAGPLIAALFEHGQFSDTDTQRTNSVLLFYSLGLTGFFIQQIIIRAFYALGDSRTPAKTAILAVITNLILNLTLIWPLASAGLACSTAICSYLQVVILVSVLYKRLGPEVVDNVRRTIFKTIAATALMAIVAIIIKCSMRNLPQTLLFNIFRLAAIVPASAVVYFLASKIMRIKALALVTSRTFS